MKQNNIFFRVLHAPLGVHALHVSLQSGADVEVDWLGFIKLSNLKNKKNSL
jgi:hypothetical protein